MTADQPHVSGTPNYGTATGQETNPWASSSSNSTTDLSGGDGSSAPEIQDPSKAAAAAAGTPKLPDPNIEDVYGGLTYEEYKALPVRERFRHQFSGPVLRRNFVSGIPFFLYFMMATMMFDGLKEHYEVRQNGDWAKFVGLGLLSFVAPLVLMVLVVAVWTCLRKQRDEGKELEEAEEGRAS
jgi:hypothetical protein